MTEQLREIGIRLMALREILDISAEEMAERCKISLEDYLAYERGDKDFSFSFLYNAADILNVDVMELMTGDAPKLSNCSFVKAGKGYSIKRGEQQLLEMERRLGLMARIRQLEENLSRIAAAAAEMERYAADNVYVRPLADLARRIRELADVAEQG